MKRSISSWQLAGFLFTSVLGTFLHFLFEFSGGSAIAALFSAVNESIWEHMKLIYYPMFLFALIEYGVFGKTVNGFWCIKLKGILLALALIPSVYYLYTGVLGFSVSWFNIAIFFLAAAAAFWVETRLFQTARSCRLSEGVAFVLLGLIGAVFTAVTFFPPLIPLFRDPITGTYGFQS